MVLLENEVCAHVDRRAVSRQRVGGSVHVTIMAFKLVDAKQNGRSKKKQKKGKKRAIFFPRDLHRSGK